MGCPRCQSLMVQETFVDWESDTGALYFTGWRCITCGDIVDPLIVQNRIARPEPAHGRARSKKAGIVIS